MSHTERVIVLVDMDCFFCQVEEKLDPNLDGKPIAVVQYNTWRGGGIIAVNYPAREKGVTRHMRGDEAKQKCPEIVLARVPEVRGKADLTKYRDAGKRVADVLKTFTPILSRASVDEAYLDITEVVKKRIATDFDKIHIDNLQNTFVVGYDIQDFICNVVKYRDYLESNCRLLMGGIIAEEIRAEVYKKTGYRCSAGIAHNKILAKLVCGLHKPNKQTILPHESVPELYKDIPIKKVTGLGGKFGATISERFKVSNMGELLQFSEKQFAKVFDEKTGKWLYNLARGIDNEPVTSRLLSKSIGCCKNFPGRSALVKPESVEHWVNELTSELVERLEKDIKENDRKARNLVVHFCQPVGEEEVSSSRTVQLNSYEQSRIVQIVSETLKKYCLKQGGTYDIRYLGLSAGNFETNKKMGNIADFFKNMSESKVQKEVDTETPEHLDSLEESVANLDENDDVPWVSEEENQTSSDKSFTEEKSDNASIYSADTEELSEDTKNLIYYEDIYPSRTAVEPIFDRKLVLLKDGADASSAGSEKPSSSNTLNRESPSTSFFSKFFENYNSSETSSPYERNFDTSKILEELNSETEGFPIHRIEQVIPELEGNNQSEADKLNSTKICPDCKKNIQLSEFTSHMDYHYALKIVKEEQHLYKPKPIKLQAQHNVTKEQSSSGGKRDTKKKSDCTKSILAYLQREELNDENSEFCPECVKRIKLDDIVSHMDYHLAKRLHYEINSKLSSSSQTNDVNSSTEPEDRKDV